VEFSLNLSAIYINLSISIRQFFKRNLAKFVAPYGNANGNSLVDLKGQLLPKNGENRIKIDP